MPYDQVDAYTDIVALREDVNFLIRALIEKKILPRPKEEAPKRIKR